jgi:hypothetical protein
MSSNVANPARTASECSSATRLWIAAGGFWFVFCIVVWGAWITGPDFKPNRIGVEQASQAYVTFVRSVEIVSIVLASMQIWYFIIRPKLRTGRFSFDGLFFLSCWMLYIQEPWINYNSDQFLYTTVAYNMGSWCNYIPGWNSPNAGLIPVGSIIWCLAYLTLVGFWAFAGSKLMGWIRRRWPHLSNWQLIGICFLAFIPADLILEHGILYSELFNYASTVPALTLHAGKIYQFPLYEIPSWCGTLTCLSAIHFFRNNAGESYGERNISLLRVGERTKTFLRFLAILGTCQAALFLFYNVPYFYWSTKGGAYPPYKEYRTAGLCGPKTKFDCPSLTTPLAKAGSPTNRVLDH